MLQVLQQERDRLSRTMQGLLSAPILAEVRDQEPILAHLVDEVPVSDVALADQQGQARRAEGVLQRARRREVEEVEVLVLRRIPV